MTGDVAIVIPARGGSKRVPRKNIRLLAGRPLLQYAVDTAAAAGLLDSVYVSTEDPEIAAVGAGGGARVVPRPEELCGDSVSTEAVLLHILDFVGKSGPIPTWLVTLPPTSPFRRAETLAFFVAAARSGQADAWLSLTESRGDYWRLDDAGRLSRLFPNASRRQQDRDPLYEENSAIYITRVDALRETDSVLGRECRGIVIDPLEGFDINTEADLAVAEALMSSGHKPSRSPVCLGQP